MSPKPVFQFLRQCIRTIFNGKHVFQRAKTATVLTVSAKHASTTSTSTVSDSPLLEGNNLRRQRNWEWLPLQTQYQAARKTIVLCHGMFSLGMHSFEGAEGSKLMVGLFGFDKLGFDSFPKLQFYYWGGIPEALRQLGCKVLITKVPRYYFRCF